MVFSGSGDPVSRASLWLLGLDYRYAHLRIVGLAGDELEGFVLGGCVILIPLGTVLVLDHEGLALDLFHFNLQKIGLGNPTRLAPGWGLTARLGLGTSRPSPGLAYQAGAKLLACPTSPLSGSP